jgi:hypothetical protein
MKVYKIIKIDLKKLIHLEEKINAIAAEGWKLIAIAGLDIFIFESIEESYEKGNEPTRH